MERSQQIMYGKREMVNKCKINLIVHNVRSTHNVGSILRTADGLGVDCTYFTGYTPYPASSGDKRLPHITTRTDNQISKTALGAEKNIKWQHIEDITQLMKQLNEQGYKIVALEQTPKAIDLSSYKRTNNVTLIVGNEVDGLEPELLNIIDTHLNIPMLGKKESFNVSVATAIALYHLRYT